MPADIREAAQHAIAAANGRARLADYVAGNVAASLCKRGSLPDRLPCTPEDPFLFYLQEAGIRVPGRRNGGRGCERFRHSQHAIKERRRR